MLPAAGSYAAYCLLACCLLLIQMPNFSDLVAFRQVAVSMIPGSLTAAEFEARKNDLKDKTVVCYCTVGYRSSAYAAKLRSAGIEAKNLEGGIVRWVRPMLQCLPCCASLLCFTTVVGLWQAQYGKRL
jgi:rhodanese-related sulfurtransferase